MNRKPFSQLDIQQMWIHYQFHGSLVKVGKMFGCCGETVKRRLREAGRKINSQGGANNPNGYGGRGEKPNPDKVIVWEDEEY